MRHHSNFLGTAIFVAASLALAIWGWAGPRGIDVDWPAHGFALIGGMVGLLLGLPVLLSALATRRRVQAVRLEPEGRLFVSAAEVTAFLHAERDQREPNEWRPTRRERRDGIDIVWAGEALLVGGYYWRFGREQYPSIYAVELHLRQTPAMVLRFRQLWSDPLRSTRVLKLTDREFRFPAPDEAAARAMTQHFLRILSSGMTARMKRKFRRLQIGAVLAGLIFLVMAVIGFGAAWHDQAQGILRSDGERVILTAITVLGIMGTPLCLAIAWFARRN